MTLLYAHMLLDDLVGVGVVHTNHGNRLHGLDESLIDGIGPDCRGNVPTVRGSIHSRNLDVHLTEGIVHIHTWPIRFFNNGNF